MEKIIKEYNLTFDLDLLNNCINEIGSNPISNRNDYFNKMVSKRLDSCSKIYIEEFENKIDDILDKTIDSDNIFEISKSIMKLSKMANSLCSVEITLYNALSN